MVLGPVMLDLQGTELMPAERDCLRHPLTGGVILFDKNYESIEQLEVLIRQIHDAREPRLLVAVDQEGGRVQRFRKDFTPLPPVRNLGHLYEENDRRARRLAEACGWLMATELRAVGIDLSFAPVLDLDRGISAVIGDRAFHADPEIVADMAHAYMSGMTRAGMAATGKHFPGHGGVADDSHVTLPVDEREYTDIYDDDLVAFERMVHFGIAGILVAHVSYPRVDSAPATFSRFWIQRVLRKRLGFQGTVFSDDLTMAAAKVAGDPLERAQAALAAGCDMVLVCHDARATEQILDGLRPHDDPASHLRLVRMHGRHEITRADLLTDEHYRQARRMVLNVA